MLFTPVLDVSFQAYSALSSIYNKRSFATNENKDMFMDLNINLVWIYNPVESKTWGDPQGKEVVASSHTYLSPEGGLTLSQSCNGNFDERKWCGVYEIQETLNIFLIFHNNTSIYHYLLRDLETIIIL